MRLAGCALLSLALMTPAAAEERIPVETVRLHGEAPSPQLTLTGVITAPRVSRLSPRVDGLIASVDVDAGDRVAAGQVLAQLDERLALLAERRLQATVTEARVARDEAARLLEEAERLVARGNLPASQAETRRADAARAEAGLARLQAEAAEVAERRRRHALIAPYDGTISARLAEAGEWVATGTPMLELIDLDGLRVDVQAPQETYPRLQQDRPVDIHVDALGGETLRGKIIARVPQTRPDARTYLLRLAIERPAAHVVPGMSVRVDLPLSQGVAAVSVPRDAVLRRADGTASLWTVDRSGAVPVAREQAVELGASRGERVEVRSDLATGVELIVRGNERLVDGQPLDVREHDGRD